MHRTNALSKHGKIKIQVLDIEGCYPNMPKETIRFALREITSEAKKRGEGSIPFIEITRQRVLEKSYSLSRKSELQSYTHSNTSKI